VDRYPFWMTVGSPTRNFAAEWRVDATVASGFLLLVVLGTLFAARRLYVASRDLRQAQEQTEASRSQLQVVTDHAPTLLAQVDREQRYRFVNAAYAALFGRQPADFVGRHISEMLGEAFYRDTAPHIARVLAGESAEFEYELRLSENEASRHVMWIRYQPERDAAGQVIGFVSDITDITARKQAEAYLEYLGKHDVLTQLRNRAFYVEELNRFRRKGPWPLSVIAIDLNGLKSINDDQGHAVGDAMLRRAGEVLAKAVDSAHCAARVGGDEFIVLLGGVDERGAVAAQERIEQMVEMNNQFYPGQPLSLAMGRATCHAGDQLDEALQRADQGMYQEKKRFYQEHALDRRRPVPIN